jgi:transposase
MNSYKAIVGLDAAQASVSFQLLDRAGQPVGRGGTAATTRAGWAGLQKYLQTHGLAPHDCLVGIEATGDLHLPWCEAFTQAGATVLALNPLVAKRTMPVSNAIRDAKDDPIDAAGLAHTLQREGAALTRFTYHSAPAQTGLRKLLSAHRAVRRTLTNLKKHTGALQQLMFPELAAVQLPQGRARRLLQAAPTPARIAALPPAQLARLAGEQADAVRTAARDSFAPAALADACVPALHALLGVIDQLELALRRLEREILVQARAAVPPARLARALELPGFGPKTTPVVLAFVPPELWTRTQARKKKVARLQALFGMDPRIRRSGCWEGRIKLSKRGCRPARTAMYQIAFCSVIHDAEMRAYYRRLTRVEKKPHKVALFDLARKHLRRLVAVLESDTPFIPRELPAAA